MMVVRIDGGQNYICGHYILLVELDLGVLVLKVGLVRIIVVAVHIILCILGNIAHNHTIILTGHNSHILLTI